MHTMIQSLKAGEKIVGFFLVKSKDIRVSSNNKNYVDYTLQDITGQVNAKHWSPLSEEDMAIPVGVVVKIEADVTMFKDQFQLKILRVREVNEQDQIDYASIVPTAPIPIESMKSEIDEFINAIGNQDMQQLVQAIYAEYETELLYYPAAQSNHHAIKGGLLYHMLRMLRAAKALCAVYSHVDRDLVYTGVLLHDIEKIEEMHANSLGVVDSYTAEGILLGHITMGVKKIDYYCRTLHLDREVCLLVEHLVLSHHYEAEYGSPKKPMIPEGEILHHIDMLDARLYDMERAIKDVEPGEFSPPVYSMERRRIYKRKE